MFLQIALDMLHTKDAMHILEKVAEYVDIIEVGTPLLKHEGIGIVRKIRNEYPEHQLLVDLKTMDVGEYEANFAFDAGGDIVTVLGVAHIETIKGAKKAAQHHHKKVMVDLIGTSNRTQKLKQLETLDIDYLGIHSGIDQQQIGQSPLQDIHDVKNVTKTPLAIAGGINLNNISDAAAHQPSIIIVGGAITGSDQPAWVARSMKELIHETITP